MAVRHQHDVDRRQRVERNAGIVVTLRAGPTRTARRAPTTPDRPGCSARRSGSASWRDRRTTTAPCRRHARRRRIGIRARRPFGPRLPLPAAAELPAQHFPQRFRRRAVGIEKMRAVEMIGRPARHRFSCGTSRMTGRRRRWRHRRAGREHGGGWFSCPIGLKTRVSARGNRRQGSAKMSLFGDVS